MSTRRTFVELAAGCCLASAVAPLRALDALNVGVGTYSYHGMSIDDMIAQLTALRVREIEMSRVEFMLMTHPQDELLKATRNKLDRAGIRCVSYYSATIKDEPDIDNAVRFAKLLGCCNITGDATGDILRRIDQRLTAEGLTVGIHNHYFPHKFTYESTEDVLNALSGLSKTMGATADTGHFASCGYDPVEAIRKLGPRLQLVHLKDIKASGGEVNVLLGTGVAKIPEVMQELRRQNFPGLVAVEYEKEGDVTQDLEQEIAFARRLA